MSDGRHLELQRDRTAVRFFLPWELSRWLDNDPGNPGLEDALRLLSSQYWRVLEVGSGHSGIYLDVQMNCPPEDVEDRVAALIKRAQTIEMAAKEARKGWSDAGIAKGGDTPHASE